MEKNRFFESKNETKIVQLLPYAYIISSGVHDLVNWVHQNYLIFSRSPAIIFFFLKELSVRVSLLLFIKRNTCLINFTNSIPQQHSLMTLIAVLKHT